MRFFEEKKACTSLTNTEGKNGVKMIGLEFSCVVIRKIRKNKNGVKLNDVETSLTEGKNGVKLIERLCVP